MARARWGCGSPRVHFSGRTPLTRPLSAALQRPNPNARRPSHGAHLRNHPDRPRGRCLPLRRCVRPVSCLRGAPQRGRPLNGARPRPRPADEARALSVRSCSECPEETHYCEYSEAGTICLAYANARSLYRRYAPQCGAVGQDCCPGYSCTAPAVCKFGPPTACVTCGLLYNPCCGGMGGTCTAGACDSFGTCVPCGGSGQPCCAGNQCNSGPCFTSTCL
ncbi:hypothetical protein DFJ74DRAFT_772389, partial [Hyaloraphidium curvatum]